MNTIFKKILLLCFVFFTQFIYADKDTTYIQISNASANEATGKMTFTVTIDALPLSAVTTVVIDYKTMNGTAKTGDDYTSKDSTDLFTPAIWFTKWSGSTSKTIEIDLIDDFDYEVSEYFYVQLSTSSTGYAVSGTGKATGTITDNDIQALELDKFENQSITETDADQVFNVVAYFNQSVPNDMTVTYKTVDGSAIAGSDYVSMTDTVNVSANSTQVVLPVTIKGDLSPELSKDFKIIIVGMSEGTVTANEATITIDDDDEIKVDVSCNDSDEGNNGDTNNIECRIYLTKDFPIGAGVTDFTVDYTSQDGSSESAIAEDDYKTTTGTVTFKEGVSEHFVNIPIIGDDTIEPDENVKLVLSGSSYIDDFDSEAEIINDDGNYSGVDFSTGDVSILEGNTSTKVLSFHFELDDFAIAGSSFEYYTQDDDAKVSDNDYVEINTTVYTIPVGTKDIDIDVIINGDTKIESDETFYLKFKNENHIVIHGHTAKGHILNDDGDFPSIKFDVPSYETVEGDSNITIVNVVMILDEPALPNSRLDYYTFDSSAKIDDNDYVKTTYFKHFFSGGESNLTVPLTINGDTNIESNEYFYFKIATVNDSNITIDGADSVKVTILNDDGNFSNFSIEAPTLVFDEKDNNQTHVDFTIRLDTPAKEDNLSIEYLTINGSAEQEDLDYNQIVPTIATFNTGEQSKVFSAYINGDTNIEPDESFFIRLQNPKNATLASSPNNQIEIIITNDDTHNEEAFTCDSSMYISSSIKRGGGSSGKMWLHKIDTTQNPFAFNVVDDAGETKLYNALAYSDSGDVNITDYIFGLYKKELVKISKTGKVMSQGNVAGLPNILTTKQLFAGAIYDGEYYISGPGQDYDKIFKIKISDKTVTEITLDKAISLLDFSFTPDGKYLHGIIDGGELVKIDLTVSPSTVTTIGTAHTGYQFDSTFSDKNGRFFANDSQGNGFFEFDLSTGDKLFLSSSQTASFNDGANCLKAALVFNDYGDAPSSYGTPRHDIVNSIYMGSEVDHDINSSHSINADGDDLNDMDDEDGITFVNGTDINGSYFAIDTTQELNITVSKDGFLNVWLDFGVDGTFNTAGDQVITALPLTAGVHTISLPIPNTAVQNQLTYVRFRYSSSSTLNSTENAADGEVEDYAIKFGTDALTGRFNIERTDSASFLPIMTDERNAWYTQIVGRDFDYSVVFYEDDFSAEKNVSNVTVKIDLMDMDTNTSLYSYVYHFPDIFVGSRKEFTLPDDLDSLPATKNAQFKVTYGVDLAGNVIQGNCAYDSSLCSLYRPDPAKDNFAIRPESFYISIADNNQIRKENTTALTDPLRVAAGYDYNLSVIATKYPSTNYNASLGYDASFMGKLEFIPSGTCANEDNGTININNSTFVDGNFNDLNFTHDDVANYVLKIKDTTWTEVDANKSQCTPNDSSIAQDTNYPSGCDIDTISNVNLRFYPHHFALDFGMNNLPDSGHDDFIYMSDINLAEQNVSFQLLGSITAQNENNGTTENFTEGCVAENVQLITDTNIRTEDGNVLPIQTSINLLRGRENVNISRMVRFNNESLVTTEFNSLPNNNIFQLNISEDEFIDEQNGSIDLDLRYNIQKHLSLTINPVQITFNALDVSSPLANSTAEGEVAPNYIPEGTQELNNTIRNFYFARVAPDQVSYPKIHFSPLNNSIRTPLNVEIFCDSNTMYCRETNVTENTDTTGLSSVQKGWYISSNHNTNNDGLVQNLNSVDNVSMNPDNNTTFTAGRNGLIVTTINACVGSNDQSIIQVIPDNSLLYHENPINNGIPTYTVSCTDQNTSELSGIGRTGNIINSRANENKTSRIDW